MAMLSEPRRRQKWTLNPRGKQWCDDSNKFGQKMLEKMGWSSGKGLGANLDGMTEHVRARYKNDQAGIGFSNNDRDKQWTQHQDGFNELLQKLQSSETAEISSIDNELSGNSLELKSAQSRTRVHYRKFTRGKDVNKYSSKDLANIFGKRDLEEKLQIPIKTEIENEVTPIEPVGSSDKSHGVVTIKGGSITDYFKNKMSSVSRRTKKIEKNEKNESDRENEALAGFGFAKSKNELEKSLETEDCAFENSAIDSPRIIGFASFKHKDYIFENPALKIDDNESERTPKRRGSKFAFENPGLALESPENDKETSTSECVEIEGTKHHDVNSMIDVSTISTEGGESVGKKKRKSKSKNRRSITEGLTHEVLYLETRVNGEEDEVACCEIPQLHLGLANDALDLSDESSGKKRVTFNEMVEYDSSFGKTRGKKKEKNKLDKFEVDNEKLRKKIKIGKKSAEIESGCSNEAMDVEIVSQESNDNAANERKIERARRKRKRRVSSLETIEEASEEGGAELSGAGKGARLDESTVGETSHDPDILSCCTPQRRKKRKTVAAKDETKIEQIREIDEIVEIVEIRSMKSRERSRSEKENKEESVVIVPIANSDDKTLTDAINEVDDIEEIVQTSKVKGTMAKGKKKLLASMNKENVKVISEDTGTVELEKKQKKCNKEKRRIAGERKDKKESERVSNDENLSKDTVKVGCNEIESQMENYLQSLHDSRTKKSKTMFKSLFIKSPIVHFAGSNINEIKGYGMDFN